MISHCPKAWFREYKERYTQACAEQRINMEKLKWENGLMRDHIQNMPGGSQFFATFLNFNERVNG